MKRVGTSGFTIVELLIVVVVIAILAAITIVSYNGITNQANDVAVKSDLTGIKKKVELYIAEYNQKPNNIQFPAAIGTYKAAQQSYMVRPVTDHNLIYCFGAAPTSYAIVGYSKSGKKFKISNDSGLVEYTNTWTDQTVACQGALSDYSGTSNYRGYAADDTTDGPWRAWAGGN